jgi:hypothetical protein
MINLHNNTSSIHYNQDVYDSFNSFIFSKDRNIFNKMYSRIIFYEMTKHLHGDIIECGVFKGSGLFTWLKLLDIYEPRSIKKVVGFDFFDESFVEELPDGVDKDTMKQVFRRVENLSKDDISLNGVKSKILTAGFSEDKFELVQGDVSKTTIDFVNQRPGARISILYLDMDLDKPTYDTLVNLWNIIVPGGVIVFDEYAYHSWSESNAVDRFINEKSLTLHKTLVKAPTAYIIKP